MLNVKPLRWALAALTGVMLTMAGCTASEQKTPPPTKPKTGSVIFLHPDGSSAAHWAALRAWHVGPDGELNWDRLPAIAVYRDHASDALAVTSNGGATIHAYGVKTPRRSFGTDGESPIVNAKGESMSVMRQAQRAGMPVGVVNSGISSEPGTACFLTSVASRGMHDEICKQLVESDADVIFGGGEKFFLPEGVQGHHGKGVRKDSLNLIEMAEAAGYTVIYTREQLNALPADTKKVLGLFAHGDTYNHQTEEVLKEKRLPFYNADAPTIAEMTTVALRVLKSQGKPFFLVVEEEGTDNFSNFNNAPGTLEAMRRADELVGVTQEHLAANPDTLIIITADTNAGGMLLTHEGEDFKEPPAILHTNERNGSPVDGIGGTGTAPFTAKPDKTGRVFKFSIVWATNSDGSGGILVRGDGLNSEHIAGSFDNTDITRMIRLTLFGDGNYAE